MFWAALGVLLVNDNLLKGHGVVPAWLTGKLSDFAFLIVAPVVLAVMLPIRIPHRRMIATLCVATLFVATDLSPACSNAVVAAAARVGLRWRLWPDPSDLIALSVLPLNLHLLREPRTAIRTNRMLAARERLGLVIGTFACLATSAPPRFEHRPFFVNRTSHSIELRVSWVLRQVSCDHPATDLSAKLGSGDFEPPVTLTIPSGEVAVLDGLPGPGETTVGECQGQREDDVCVAAILETAGAQPVLFVADPRWSESADGAFLSCSRRPDPVSRCEPRFGAARDPGPDAVSLVMSGSELGFKGTRVAQSLADAGATSRLPHVQIADIDLSAVAARTTDAQTCSALYDEIRGLRNATSCGVDADCQGFYVPALPGDNEALCNAYVNRSVSAKMALAWVAAWSANCTSTDTSCAAVQPPACRDGKCGPLCPSQRLEDCPVRCDVRLQGQPAANTDAGACGSSVNLCLNDVGDVCACENGQSRCEPDPLPPGCPIACAPLDYSTPGVPAAAGHRSPSLAGIQPDEDAGMP